MWKRVRYRMFCLICRAKALSMKRPYKCSRIGWTGEKVLLKIDKRTNKARKFMNKKKWFNCKTRSNQRKELEKASNLQFCRKDKTIWSKLPTQLILRITTRAKAKFRLTQVTKIRSLSQTISLWIQTTT